MKEQVLLWVELDLYRSELWQVSIVTCRLTLVESIEIHETRVNFTGGHSTKY